MSTIGCERHLVLRIFMGCRECTGHHAMCGALLAAGPYLRLSRFQGGQAVKQKRQLFTEFPPMSPNFLTLSSTATSRTDEPMCNCRSHGTFPLFGLQSSHLNICYYHQDLHRLPLRPGSRPRFYSDCRALLLIEAWLLPRRLVDSAGELLRTP
ncbi:hypothetical protein YC2023_066346 [Brassica napus]